MLHRESALLAISLEDRSLEIVDIITRKIVRKFFDIHNGNIGCQIFNEIIPNRVPYTHHHKLRLVYYPIFYCGITDNLCSKREKNFNF